MKISREEAIRILTRYDNEYYTPETRQAHRMGAEALREQEERRWIPVTERLPEKKTLVLCIGARGGMFIAKGMTRFSDGTCFCDVPNARSGRYATHWMPLPEGPGEGE